MTTKRAADQLAYPAVVLLIDRATGRTYQAVAIADAEDCNPEHIGACCMLGHSARPRYIVDGIERPDFNPTIPDDLRALGWFWHGGWLVHCNEPPPKGCGIVIGMPVADLDELWAKARKFDFTITIQQGKTKKPKEQKPAAPPKEHKGGPPPSPAPAVVVGKGQQPAVEQLAIW